MQQSFSAVETEGMELEAEQPPPKRTGGLKRTK